jgi:hypothetical protein
MDCVDFRSSTKISCTWWSSLALSLATRLKVRIGKLLLFRWHDKFLNHVKTCLHKWIWIATIWYTTFKSKFLPFAKKHLHQMCACFFSKKDCPMRYLIRRYHNCLWQHTTNLSSNRQTKHKFQIGNSCKCWNKKGG